MDLFTVDDAKIQHISEKFDVEKDSVRLVHKIFVEAITEVKYQYLAHIIRTMEVHLRKKTNNPMFQINCEPLLRCPRDLKVGCAQYFAGQFFTIFFNPAMDEKQLRVCLAHELGHLFIVELLNEVKPTGSKPYTKESMTEPLSSIFGVFTILEKNHFYRDVEKPFNHSSWQDIVEDFVNLQNEKRH